MKWPGFRILDLFDYYKLFDNLEYYAVLVISCNITNYTKWFWMNIYYLTVFVVQEFWSGLSSLVPSGSGISRSQDVGRGYMTYAWSSIFKKFLGEMLRSSPCGLFISCSVSLHHGSWLLQSEQFEKKLSKEEAVVLYMTSSPKLSITKTFLAFCSLAVRL